GSATPDPVTGEYRVSGLPAGSYRLQFAVTSYVDPSTSTTVRPNLVPEYYDDATWENATPVVVTAGQSRTGINAALAAGATLRG
ncbi:hypothetical protein, partial [Klebsiella pneumoniae]|uniref:hypothetical protein n=1 Tax=Klebsiella pneumoniae TaxID=573 RepID=UPI001954A760